MEGMCASNATPGLWTRAEGRWWAGPKGGRWASLCCDSSLTWWLLNFTTVKLGKIVAHPQFDFRKAWSDRYYWQGVYRGAMDLQVIPPHPGCPWCRPASQSQTKQHSCDCQPCLFPCSNLSWIHWVCEIGTFHTFPPHYPVRVITPWWLHSECITTLIMSN